MTSLPDKPSELIRLAIGDMQLCEQDPQYNINMDYWHWADKTGCQVCMAGAVMAQTLKVSPKDDVDVSWGPCTNPADDKLLMFSDLTDDERIDLFAKFKAINEFRAGRLGSGAIHLGIPNDAIDFGAMYKGLSFSESKPYNNKMAMNLPRFYKDMLTIADKFENLGY